MVRILGKKEKLLIKVGKKQMINLLDKNQSFKTTQDINQAFTILK
jgi:hypothetical protein